MKFWYIFLNSLQLPKKQAMFKLNRTGMDMTVVYMFILLFFVSLPILVHQLTNGSGPAAYMNLFFLVIYFFIFSYLPLTIMFFILLSMVAYAGVWIATFLKRRLRFSLLWKMSAYLTTIPLLLYALLSFFVDVSNHVIWLVLLYLLLFLIKIITVYPKRKQRKPPRV